MLCFFYFLVGVTIYGFADDLIHRLLYSRQCYPTRISPELDSFFILMRWLIVDQLWMFPIILYFWPTKAHKKRDAQYQRGQELFESFTTDNSTNNRNSSSFMDTGTQDSQELPAKSIVFSPKINMKHDAAYLSFSPRTSVDPRKEDRLLAQLKSEYESQQNS